MAGAAEILDELGPDGALIGHGLQHQPGASCPLANELDDIARG